MQSTHKLIFERDYVINYMLYASFKRGALGFIVNRFHLLGISPFHRRPSPHRTPFGRLCVIHIRLGQIVLPTALQIHLPYIWQLIPCVLLCAYLVSIL